jgi:polysaccharide export outer membrane protein
MAREWIRRTVAARAAWWALCLLLSGCKMISSPPPPPDVPRELKKVSLPAYVIEPPDILNIDAVRLVPRPPYRIGPLDALGIQVTNTLPDQPIAGVYTVEVDGTVNLGFTYGSVQVLDLTLEEARKAIDKFLEKRLKRPFEVTVVLSEARAMQQIRGPHLVRPDGTISLGVYGSVYVDNLTIPEARKAIEVHLEQYLLRPEVSVDVSGFNSQVYYVVIDGGGVGEQVIRVPVTGKNTVLDALGLTGGLGPVSSRFHIWVARPTPNGPCQEQTLKVDWNGIVRRGDTTTNYQLFPGDRVYVKADQLVTIDTYIARIISPIERMLGVTLLGATTIEQLENMGRTIGTTTGTTTTTVIGR